MRYFVTGATGFVGLHLVRLLRAEGHEVVALVRDPAEARAVEQLGVTLAVGDVTDWSSLARPMRDADGVFHVAGWYRIGAESSQAEAVNVEGTRNVLETMQELGIAKGVYTSTLAVNSDTHGAHVDESYRYDGPHLSTYDQTKWRAHFEVALPLMEQDLPLVIVMPGLVYGAGDTGQLGALMQRAIDGERIMLPGSIAGVCWTHVEDVARAHLLAMERGKPRRSYVIAGPCHTLREGFETLARVTGAQLRIVWVPPLVLRGLAPVMSVVERLLPVPEEYSAEALRTGGGTTYYGDNSRAKRELGYEPRSLEEGLRETFAMSASTT